MNDEEEHGGLRDDEGVEAGPGRLTVAPGNIGAGRGQRMDARGTIDWGNLGGAAGGGGTGPAGALRGADMGTLYILVFPRVVLALYVSIFLKDKMKTLLK